MAARPIPPLARHVGDPLLIQHPFVELGVAAVERAVLGQYLVGLAHALEQGLGKNGLELAGGGHQRIRFPLLALAQLAQAIQVLDVLYHAQIHAAVVI